MVIEISQKRAPGTYGTGKRVLVNGVLVLLLFLTLTTGMLSTQVRAQMHDEYSDEYRVKAAFLYKLIKFVEWPEDAFRDSGAPVVIGIVGNDPFGNKIDQMINGKIANGRPLVLKRFPNLKTLTHCHVLFICSSEKNDLQQALAAAGVGVLTVGETERFIQMGGIINFTIVDSKIRFAINQFAAERAGLKISARLLNLSRPARK